MTSLIISFISISIAIVSVVFVVLNYKKDNARVELTFDIMCNTDHSKEWLRIHFMNTGRRPVCIKSVGYYDWVTGYYLSGENKEINIILREAEISYCDEHISRDQMWRVKTIFVRDHKDRLYKLNNKKMRWLYDSAHKHNPYRTNPKYEKKHKKRMKRSVKSYLRFCKKHKYKSKFTNNEVYPPVDI